MLSHWLVKCDDEELGDIGQRPQSGGLKDALEKLSYIEVSVSTMWL